jgi:predicted MFS family arabinose efflux permease
MMITPLARRGARYRTAGQARSPIFTRALLFMFVADFGSLTSFFLLLSVVPLYAASSGAGRAGAGLATAALTFATVAGELLTPRLVARFGYRAVFGAGVLLLGLPTLALSATPAITVIVAVSVIRGIGFAFTVVAGSAIIASLIPADRRGEGLGLYGVGAGVPSVVALPLGVWLARHVGYPAVFTTGAVAALAGFAALPVLPGRRPAPAAGARPRPEPGTAAGREAGHRDGMLAGLRSAGLVRPAVTFAITAMAAGAVVTFVPLALARAPEIVAPAALLAQPAAATVARWLAGRHGDRHGPARLLVPGVAVAALGVLGTAVALAAFPAAVIPAMFLFGAGFGVVQNSSLALMYRRAPAGGYSTVSATWNVAYDAGLGLGGAGFGVLAVHGSYPAAFGLTAVLMLAALMPAWRDRAG